MRSPAQSMEPSLENPRMPPGGSDGAAYLPVVDGGIWRAVPRAPRARISRTLPPPTNPRAAAGGSSSSATSSRPGAARGGPAIEVEVLGSDAELDGIRREWTALVDAGDGDRVFLSWEWLATWWRVLGDGKLSVVTFRRGGELVGLAPLRRASAMATAGGAWALAATTTLRFLGTGQVGTDYLDVVALPGEERVVAGALARWLEDENAILELEQLSSRDGGVVAHLAEILERRDWTSTVRRSHVCPWADLEGETFESFVSGLGRSHRQNLRRRLRKIEKRYEDVRLEVARSGPELDEALEVLFDLHDLRWDPRGGSDAFSDPGIRAFHRAFLREAAGRGWPRLFVLRLDGAPAAALYGLFDGERFLFYQSGFDPAFSDDSVGLVLMGMTFEAAIGEGAREYDFLHGEERYKSHWCDRSRHLLRRELFPPTLHGRFRHGLRRLETEARSRLRELRGSGEEAPS